MTEEAKERGTVFRTPLLLYLRRQLFSRLFLFQVPTIYFTPCSLLFYRYFRLRLKDIRTDTNSITHWKRLVYHPVPPGDDSFFCLHGNACAYGDAVSVPLSLKSFRTLDAPDCYRPEYSNSNPFPFAVLPPVFHANHAVHGYPASGHASFPTYDRPDDDPLPLSVHRPVLPQDVQATAIWKFPDR